MDDFKTILISLLSPVSETGYTIFDPASHFKQGIDEQAATAQSINAAFLIVLAGEGHSSHPAALNFLNLLSSNPEWAGLVAFYTHAVDQIYQEIDAARAQDPDFNSRLHELAHWLNNENLYENKIAATEKIWSLFFPEATGIWGHSQERIQELRKRRTVRLRQLNPDPLLNPAREMLFTSNVLLTLPPKSKPVHELPLSEELKQQITSIAHEPQMFWYDHPIQIGVKPENNEVLHGLRGLDQALSFERARGSIPKDSQLSCALSVSVTHPGLQKIARPCLEEVFTQAGGLRNLRIYIFTEHDARRLVTEVLGPAAERFLGYENPEHTLGFFGVDGEYGRHYSFLKAIAAIWQVLFDPQIRATYKIDLDQVFPQDELVAETGASAFEHFKSPLWGAHALDAQSNPLELGMIAGALVNESDIHHSLFTPDVTFPDPETALSLDEHIFFSRLPQALSTHAEMMARYDREGLDGERQVLQRVHVTGGTNGIRVRSLRRFRPFTPSFIGRAEDQAYLLSTITRRGERLAYLHAAGLIMRHDKEAFAQNAIQAAHTGKLVGDYIRILYYSAYARVLSPKFGELKQFLDPFTGCFISRIPVTVVHLRFALKAASLFAQGEPEKAIEFLKSGSVRIAEALDFTQGSPSPLKAQFEKERSGWDLFYDILDTLEARIQEKDPIALDLRNRAVAILNTCALKFKGHSL